MAKGAVAVRESSKAMSNIDAELSKEVAELKQQIGQSQSRRITLDNKAGKFISPEGQDLGDSIEIVVLDFISANRYYPETYDPNKLSAPICYAYGKIIDEMAPDDDSLEKQNDICKTCKWNQWKSSGRGNAKACKNTREIAVLVGDATSPDQPVWTFSVPPTGIQSFDGFVAGVGRTLNGPPIKARVKMTAKDAGTYTTVTFEDPVPNRQYVQHAARRGECMELLVRKPDYSQTATPAAKNAGKRGR